MSIKGYVDELEQIEAEIKRNNSRNKALRDRTRVLKDEIRQYLESKDQEGVKYKGKAIILERKDKRLSKNKSDKKNEAISILESAGVENPENVYNNLLESQKGDPIEQINIKFKKLPVSKV